MRYQRSHCVSRIRQQLSPASCFHLCFCAVRASQIFTCLFQPQFILALILSLPAGLIRFCSASVEMALQPAYLTQKYTFSVCTSQKTAFIVTQILLICAIVHSLVSHVVLMLHASFVDCITAVLPAATCGKWTDLSVRMKSSSRDLWQ